MRDQWSRLIEAERRLARSESDLRRLASQMSGIRQNVKTQAQNPSKPVQGGGGGGGGSMVRFPDTYTIRVEWDTEPTLKTGASSNPTADTTSLQAAVDGMATGRTFNNGDLGGGPTSWWYDTTALYAFQHIDLLFTESPYASEWMLAKIDGGDFKIDFRSIGDGTVGGGYLSASSDRFYLSCSWDRRNGIGSIIGTDLVTARRTSGSTATFSSGPVYSETGSWSFAMECPATTYHNAGSGTLYLEW